MTGFNNKRQRQDSDLTSSSSSPQQKIKRNSSSILGISRSISACKRCRQKKIKCSHDFPKCAGCQKAKVDCVSIDPATGREIPRSYIMHLENRVEELEKQVKSRESSSAPIGTDSQVTNTIQQQQQTSQNNSNFFPPPANTSAASEYQSSSVSSLNNRNLPDKSPLDVSINSINQLPPLSSLTPISQVDTPQRPSSNPVFYQQAHTPSSNSLPNPVAAVTTHSNNNANINTVSPVPTSALMDRIENSTTASGSRQPSSFMGATSGITFAKLMFTALHFKGNENSSSTLNQQQAHSGAPSTTNPYYKRRLTLTDPSILKKTAENSTIALLPPKQQALDLVSLYFAQSNSQLPIFHREEFLRRYFQPIYGDVPVGYSFASNYTSINRESLIKVKEEDTWYHQYTRILDDEIQKQKDIDPLKVSASITPPAEFRVPLYFMNIVFSISSTVTHLQYPGHISDNFKNAALRYVDEVYASSDKLESLQGVLTLTLYSLMRPSIPGVWYMLGSALRICVDMGLHNENRDSGVDNFTLDLRRRLFWCCYSLDRQVCFYLGRPFGIPEENCHVPFPSDLDDALITREDENMIPDYSTRTSGMPSYKAVSLTMFRMRKLQAEIQNILYDKKELPRKFRNQDDWFQDMTRRLDLWKLSAPKTQRKMNCDFSFEFFSMNYNHAKLMLNGLSPIRLNLSLENYINLAEAAKEIIFSYYELYTCKLMNYTWAATHNLFMAGSSYLYAIFNCDEAKTRAPLQEVQNVALYCNVILKSLTDKCDAAGTCRDIFEILVAAVIKLRYTPNIINSINLDDLNIPSNESIAKAQPGRHISENLKDLVSSLPNSLQQQEKLMQQQFLSKQKAQVQQQQQQPSVVKSSNSGPVMTILPSTPTKVFVSVKEEPSSLPFEWSTNESDLNRFFEELQRVPSPTSSVRSASDGHSPGVARHSTLADHDYSIPQSQLQQTPLNYGQMNYVPVDYSMKSMVHQTGGQHQDPYLVQHSFNPHQQQPQQTPGAPKHQSWSHPTTSATPGMTNIPTVRIGSVFSPPSLHHQQQPSMPQSQITSPFPTSTSASSSDSPTYNPNTGRVIVPAEIGKKLSKEGQRIYKMIYQVPTESIWDQFFGGPFSNEEI